MGALKNLVCAIGVDPLQIIKKPKTAHLGQRSKADSINFMSLFAVRPWLQLLADPGALSIDAPLSATKL